MCSLPSLRFRRLWTPQFINTSIWFDASDSSTITITSGAVSQWSDKSGNGRNATQTTPDSRPVIATGDLNNKNTISFDGSNDFLNIARGFFSGTTYSVFLLATPDQGTEGYLIQFFNPGPTQSAIITKYSSISYEYFFSDAARFTLGSPSLTGYNILSFDVTGTSVSGYSNGQFSNSGTIPSVSLEFRQIANAITQFSTYSNYAQTKIAELVILPAASSTSTRQKMEGYLAHKWGLTAKLPSDHPFKLNHPRGI